MTQFFGPFAVTEVSLHAIALLAISLMLLWLRRWPLLFALFVWPGTVAHELLHFFAGWITGAKPVSLSIIPHRNPEGGWVLGSVAFARLRWWNSLPVGLAPLALLPSGGVLFIHSMFWPLLSLQGAGIKLVAVQCLIAGWPSPRDWSHAMMGLLMAGMILLMGYLLIMRMDVLSL
jgi:hypothetical protein